MVSAQIMMRIAKELKGLVTRPEEGIKVTGDFASSLLNV